MTEQDVIAAFAVLECEPYCSPDELKSSYRQLVQVWHPDRFDGNPKLKLKATEKMKLINDAYQLLEMFFERAQKHKEPKQAEGASTQPANPDTRASSNRAQPKEADYEVGREKVEITKELDSQSGQVLFKKVVETITGYNGRWLSTQTKVFKTRSVNAGDSFELAAKHSISFSLKPEQGRIVSRGDGSLEGLDNYAGPSEHESENSYEWLFPDGSSVEIGGGKTDTWFHDEKKKAAHGRTSSNMADLQEAHAIFKRRGDWEACLEIAERAVDLEGLNIWGWLRRSEALDCTGFTEEAYEALVPAANVLHKEILIPYELACYAARIGDLQDSKRWLERVFDMAEKEGPYSSLFERYQEIALKNPDLIPVRDHIPKKPLSWKVRKYFGV